MLRLLGGNPLAYTHLIPLPHGLHEHMLPTPLDVLLLRSTRPHRRENEPACLPTKYFQQRVFTHTPARFDANYLTFLKEHFSYFRVVRYIEPAIPPCDAGHLNDVQKRKVFQPAAKSFDRSNRLHD